jgi:hypothetical protein
MDTDFLVCTNTSKEVLGRVLIWKLTRHEENYVMHDLELLSIVYAFNFWRTTFLEKNMS